MKDAPVLTRWSIQVRDWLGSDTLRGMSLEAEALFLRLCLDQWEHGAARPEKERWRKVHGNRCSDFEVSWAEASAPFQLTPLGLVHPRVARDRELCIGQITAKIRGAEDAAKHRPRDAAGRLLPNGRPGYLEDSSRTPPGILQVTPGSASSSASVSGSESEEPEKRASRAPRKLRISAETYPIPSELDSPAFRIALSDYLRTRKGGAWDEALAETSFRKMLKWGRERSIAALENSQGAQGLFEPSGGRANGNLFKRPDPEPPKYLDLDAHFAAEDARAAAQKEAQ